MHYFYNGIILFQIDKTSKLFKFKPTKDNFKNAYNCMEIELIALFIVSRVTTRFLTNFWTNFKLKKKYYQHLL